MRFNVEIDIDWIDEESNINEEISNGIISTLTNKIHAEFLKGAGQKLADKAELIVAAKTSEIINTVLEQSITITNGWNNKKEYSSIHEMIEEQMSQLYTGKINSVGTCKEDPLLANLKKYIDCATTELLSKVDKKVKGYASDAASKAVEENKLIKALDVVLNQ